MNGRGEKALDILRRGWEFLGRLAREYRQHAEINKGSRTTLLSGLEAEGPRCVPGGEVGLTEDGRSDGELKGPAVSTSSAETGGGEESAPMTRSLRELMEDLRDASPRVRGEAAKELGKRGGPGVEGALEPLLEDADEGVRSTAVRALRDLAARRR